MLTNKKKRELDENVLRGCRLLDRRRPRWFEQIDLEAFDLTNGGKCICGQLSALSEAAKVSGVWTSYADVLFGGWNWPTKRAAKHGFTIVDLYDDDRREAWARSEDTWRREIRARRRAKAAA